MTDRDRRVWIVAVRERMMLPLSSPPPIGFVFDAGANGSGSWVEIVSDPSDDIPPSGTRNKGEP